jgi:hypothetical protein
MTLKRLTLMAVLTYGLLALWAWTGSTSNTETLLRSVCARHSHPRDVDSPTT